MEVAGKEKTVEIIKKGKEKDRDVGGSRTMMRGGRDQGITDYPSSVESAENEGH